MLTILHAVFQFMLRSSDPSWSCAVTHRDPGLPGTYYLICSKALPSGIEVDDVLGGFVPDAPVKEIP